MNGLLYFRVEGAYFMPRPRKCRKVCCLPESSQFGPLGMSCDQEHRIVMTVDEYETVRLIDFAGFTQEECAKQMKIARTTVQRIYNEARKKLAEVLVNGKVLRIEGGDYKLCDGLETFCRCGGCHRHSSPNKQKEDDIIMKIALPTRQNLIDDHFGHCEYYTVFTIDDSKNIVDQEIIASPVGCGCKSNIAQTLSTMGVTILLAGNMGDGAMEVLKNSGIKVVRGCSGDVKTVALNWLTGSLTDSGDSCHEHECHN